MRRTYKSKKETGGALDHRDVLLTMDSKSSLFDAFYINNIKQTKRELSVVPSVQFAASNRVRKRKYVKRLKEQEPVVRESSSTSAFLTPDKSFRVNKAPDPFDQLLNSSNRSLIETNKSNSIKKQKSKTYCQMKLLRKKKINYSSGNSTDSDKENSDSSIKNETTQNNSDVLSHKLLIEREHEKSPKQDESIADIVKNLSLFKESKDKVSTSPRGVKHRITHLSEISNSPLCSTPFFDKYRGKSIYKFSPISINLNDSPSSLIVPEANNDVENSIIEVKEKKHDSYNEIKQETINDLNEVSCEVQSPILPYKTSNDIPKTKTATSDHLPEVTLQTSELEPFLGFTNTKVPSTIDLDTIADKWNKLEKDNLKINLSVEVINDCVSNTNKNSIEDIEVIEKEKQSNSSVDGSHTNSILESDDNESFYGTCNSEDFEDDKQPIVVIEKLNDSIYQKYSDKMADYFNDSNKTHSEVSNDAFSDECASVNDRSSISDSSEHDNISSESIIGDEICEENISKISKDDHLQNHSLDSDSNSDVNKTEEHDTISIESIIGDEICEENTSKVSKDDHLQNHSLDSDSNSDVNKIEEYDNISRKSIISDEICEENTSQISKDDHLQNYSIDSDSNSDVNKSEDEVYISFVTTRRRNEIINDSFILGLDNSITSGSSAEVDKTVLKRDSIIEDLEGNTDKTLIKDKPGDSNADAKNISNNNIVQEGHNIETVSKFSPNDSNKSISKEKSVHRTSFKLRRGSKPPNAINISKNVEIDSNVTNKVMTRKSVRLLTDNIGLRSSMKSETSASSLRRSAQGSNMACDLKQGIVLQPGKRWERSLSIYRRMTTMSDHFDSSILDDEPLNNKGRKYRQSVISTMEMQDFKGSLYNDSINSRRSTFVSKPSRSTIRIVRDLDISRSSLCSTSVLEESQGFLTEDCDDTIVELSKLSIADSEHEVTVLKKFHDTSSRFPTARDYVLRRCNQTDIVLFDECYPDTVLKNCRKIGEGVYGEVFLWRAGDGKARVLKIIPIAGNIKVNGENQKDYNEIISEIVIAMELSSLRAPIDEIEQHFNEGKSIETLDLHSVENATDVFNEVLAVRCVYGTYPSRLLDLWDLYDECKGSENDNPAILPIDQQYIVLELANAGQDLESYQFNNAEQAYALFKQVAFGLAVAEEAYQFEHRDLHWGNVLISPTDQKYATFVIRGRVYRVARRGVAASLIDYSLSRASLRLPSGTAELYNDLSTDDSLFDAVGDYQFEVYRLMRDKLGNDWKNFEPYTNILWLHYTVDKMITSLRYSRTNTKIHKHYIAKLKEIKNRVLDYGSAVQYVLTDNDL